MPGVTISSPFGAGGGVVAPKVAEKLGLPFLDRAISGIVAEKLRLSYEEAVKGGETPSRMDRVLRLFAPLLPEVTGDPTGGEMLTRESVRAGADEVMRTAMRDGQGAVILGRAGAVALADEPGVLHVRLHGDVIERIKQGAALGGYAYSEASRHQGEIDRARAAYVQRLYNRDPDDESLYDIQIDSTKVSLEVCVDMIVIAYQAFRARTS
ncbi:MAG TPA: cytidylate kinase-like family protein [Mycobacteriales bacterium]|nr:cytidylate kinase-like family protein [Mycobacteriales bacterium]